MDLLSVGFIAVVNCVRPQLGGQQDRVMEMNPWVTVKEFSSGRGSENGQLRGVRVVFLGALENTHSYWLSHLFTLRRQVQDTKSFLFQKKKTQIEDGAESWDGGVRVCLCLCKC